MATSARAIALFDRTSIGRQDVFWIANPPPMFVW
jgi:hypothetical protein